MTECDHEFEVDDDTCLNCNHKYYEIFYVKRKCKLCDLPAQRMGDCEYEDCDLD